MATPLSIYDRSYTGGNPYASGTNAYNAQSAFAAMTKKAEQNIVRDPRNKGVVGYTEAAGVTPLPGQTVNIYDPTKTKIIGTKTGQPLDAPATLPLAAEFEEYTKQMQDYLARQKQRQEDSFTEAANKFNEFLYGLKPQGQAQTASVRAASTQQRRMGSSGSSFGRGDMRIKSLNI